MSETRLRSTHARRRWLKGAVAVFAVPLTAAFTARVIAAVTETEPVIKVIAKRFQYVPDVIALKAGQTTLLEITSMDFIHGMKIPDLNIRADLPPGRVTQVRVKFDKPGSYDFLCDNFCGDGHEEMSGKFIVT